MLRPWLLEVNRCPSLTHDCHVDRIVKKPLLHHLFDLVGPPRVPEPLTRPLRPPFLLLLARKHSQSPLSAAFQLNRYRRLITGCSRSSRCLPNCEGCEVGMCSRRCGHSIPNANQNIRGSRYRNALTTKPSSTPSTTSTATPATIRKQYSTSSSSSSSSTTSRDGRGMKTSGSSSSSSRRCKKVNMRDGRWPARCGEWVRIFPFNAASLHAGKDPAYLKTGIGELTKYRRACERAARSHPPLTSPATLERAVRVNMWRDTVLWAPPV